MRCDILEGGPSGSSRMAAAAGGVGFGWVGVLKKSFIEAAPVFWFLAHSTCFILTRQGVPIFAGGLLQSEEGQFFE